MSFDINEITPSPRPTHAGRGTNCPESEPFSRSCRALLEEAGALGLDLADVIAAMRRHANNSNHAQEPTTTP